MQIEELTIAERPEVVEILAEAFHEYPIFKWVLSDVDGDVYKTHLRLLIGFFVDARLMRGWPVLGVREEGNLVGALLLSDPVFKPRPEPLNRVHREISAVVGTEALERMEAFESALRDVEVDRPTYFVGMIGVRPSSQGKGYARALMERVAEMSRERPESQGVTLTTEDPSNLDFYKRLGYKVLGNTKVGNFTSWFLAMDT